MKRFLALMCILVLSIAGLVMAEQVAPTTEGTGSEEVLVVASDARTLKNGMKGEDVKQLQTRLKELRYYAGPITGNYLKATMKAVKDVQAAYGLKETGEADAATQEIIYGDAHRPLQKGTSGQDVSRLQTRLSELGFYVGKVSGNFMAGTFSAVESFQKTNGLNATGVADIATLEKLYSDDIVMPTPDPNATPTPVPKPTTPPDTTFPGNMAYGSKNKAVRQLQERLRELGYFDRKPTGGYYKQTTEAVKAFQKRNGVWVDGNVGADTWKALYAEDVVSVSGMPKPAPEPTPVPYFIEVDVNNQLIKVFERGETGEFTDLSRVFWCSTGTKAFPSDIGTFTLTGRRALWAEFPNWGGGKARYWVRVTPSVAIHSVIYNTYDVKSVSMKAVNALGRPASHGCIRLATNDAKWMYENARAGVQVKIHEEAALDPELKFANKPGPFSREAAIHVATPVPTTMPTYNAANVPEIPSKPLKLGAEGEAVVWLQHRLSELGYYHGTITGQFREGTRDAVKAYQKDNKLNQDGAAGKLFMEHIIAATLESLAPASPEPPMDPSAAPVDEALVVEATPAISPSVTPAPAGGGEGETKR